MVTIAEASLPEEINPNQICNAVFNEGVPITIEETQARYISCPMCQSKSGYLVRDISYLAWSCFKCINKNINRIKEKYYMKYHLPDSYKHASVKKIEKKYHKDLIEWFDRMSSPFLILVGGLGCGKTYAAHSLASLYYQNKGGTVRFFFFGDIYLRYKEEMQSQAVKTLNYQIRDSDLLIIDDFGLEMVPTDNFIDMILAHLDYRLSNNKQTIITTNKNFDQIREIFGDRLASRLSQAKIIKMTETDRRRNGN